MYPSRMMRSLIRTPARFGVRSELSYLAKIEESVKSLPMREAAMFKDKSMKWTAGDYKMYADAHANCLLEYRMKKGDKVALWMEASHHKHLCLLAYAKMGMVVYDVDPKISSVEDIRAFLKASDCKMIVFPPVTETQDNLRLLRYSIPELFDYTNDFGQHFRSKHFKNLRYLVHTGFDIEIGAITFKSMFYMDPDTNRVDAEFKSIGEDLPFYSRISRGEGGKGIVVAPVKALKDCIEEPELGFIKNLSEKVYFELN